MKKEDLRPIEYRRFINYDHNGEVLVAKYADPVNGWFHGWEKQTDSQPSENMQAVIELEDGSIKIASKREFNFKQKQLVKNQNLRPITVRLMNMSLLGGTLSFADQNKHTENSEENYSAAGQKSIYDQVYKKTKGWLHKILDDGNAVVEYENGQLAIENVNNINFTDIASV